MNFQINANLQVSLKKDEQALRESWFFFFCFVEKASSPERKAAPSTPCVLMI